MNAKYTIMELKSLFRMAIVAMLLVVTAAFDAQALTGAWRGELSLGPMQLPLVFNFLENATGSTQCTLDSPAQGAKGIPASVVFCSADSIAVDCSSIGAAFRGGISAGVIKGTFSQRGHAFPLTLTPEMSIEERRPQTPRPPFPYTVIDTTFTAPDGAVMSATLTIPPAPGRDIPAVVMVTGSGQQNRDEEIMEHRPFAVIADRLARHGIASLRYDDRGTGGSTGDFSKATTDTLAADALAALRFLRGVPGIGKAGVLGHSEGGTISFIIGSEGEADFIVSLAGMAVSGKEALIHQNRLTLRRAGLDEARIDKTLRLIGHLFDAMAEQGRRGVMEPIDVDSIAHSSGLTVDPQIMASLRQQHRSRSVWFDVFLGLDPSAFLGRVKCPVLAINGDKDVQVDAESNLSLIKSLVPQAEIRLMPGLNHMMQHAVTGEVSEYGQIRETISPEVLEIITRFIDSLK